MVHLPYETYVMVSAREQTSSKVESWKDMIIMIIKNKLITTGFNSHCWFSNTTACKKIIIVIETEFKSYWGITNANFSKQSNMLTTVEADKQAALTVCSIFLNNTT